jgi:hypothetical protein
MKVQGGRLILDTPAKIFSGISRCITTGQLRRCLSMTRRYVGVYVRRQKVRYIGRLGKRGEKLVTLCFGESLSLSEESMKILKPLEPFEFNGSSG